MSAVQADRLADDVEVQVGPMRRRHLRSVLRIESHAEHQGWSLGLYLNELSRQSDRIYLVAKVSGTVVGFAGLMRVADDGHVTTIAVDPQWQGRKVATRLLLVMIRRAIASGATAITLEVRASYEPAIALYRTFGFAPAGMRKNYYRDLGEDALVMWATELDNPEYRDRLVRIEASLPSPTSLEGVGW